MVRYGADSEIVWPVDVMGAELVRLKCRGFNSPSYAFK